MTWRPRDPATEEQYAMIRRLAVASGRAVPPALTRRLAARYILELLLVAPRGTLDRE